ncbi:hypothetical protein BDY24DRAFT_397367 [Mrakia frigida]|uniref:F1F0 ATP synthase subunit g n=1 Tax=Mrakia frigida TaxID=29902 RepID=UPI003FCC0DBF
MSSPFFRSPAFKAALKRTYASQPGPTVESARKGAESALEKAQKTAVEVLAAAQKAAGPTGDKIASRLSSINSYVVYNAKLIGALAKQVYVAEKLAPPTSVGEIVGGWSTVWARGTSWSYWGHVKSSGEWKPLALYSLQAYGIFTVGEIIGKRHFVGYELEDNYPIHPAPSAHH